MKRLSATELRAAYLAFFAERGHTVRPSDSLIPENDPTLLFTGAGMNQFKDMFLGVGNLPFKRATTCQKCLRTGDLEVVGATPRHHTFFEMLGNFSFGDYFKKEAIEWAWEFLTGVLGIPEGKLSVTVHTTDDEAAELWRGRIGLPASRIERRGDHDNFWPADAPAQGPNGPCGPCSEIYYDLGEGVNEADRQLEIWNPVFTQFDRSGPVPGEGALNPLRQKNIDTGMGFERLVAVLQGVKSNFDTELFMPIITRLSQIAGRAYVFDSASGVKMRRIADHARAAAFCVADGATPGNVGRRYVVRKIIRRAVRDGVDLGISEPFLHKLAPVVSTILGPTYPELPGQLATVQSAIENEEVQFRRTLDKGLARISLLAAELTARHRTTLDGEAAFALFAEQGMPLEIVKEEMAGAGIVVDAAGFEAAMARHREVSGGATADTVFEVGPFEEIRAGRPPTRFLGHTEQKAPAKIAGIIAGDRRVEQATSAHGDVALILDRTPFYGESGGQVGDRGRIASRGAEFVVHDTKRVEGYHLHLGRVRHGALSVDEPVEAQIDAAWREAVKKNHTATHLLHQALRRRMPGAAQAGSLVAPDRLRFDVSFTRREFPDLADLERDVNALVLANLPVRTEEMPLARARELGAIALFGEKYGDQVRLVNIGDGASRELCGGTHVAGTGEIGGFRVTSLAPIAASVLRVEAVTGAAAIEAAGRDRAVLAALSTALKARAEELPRRVEALQGEVKALRKELDEVKNKQARGGVEDLIRAARRVGDAAVVAGVAPGAGAKNLREMSDLVKGKVRSVVVVLGSDEDGKPNLVVAATRDLVERGFDAGAVIKEIAPKIGGGGGGRKEFAQAGGKDAAGLHAAVEAGADLAARMLGGLHPLSP
ncbi:MAG: alanine--tRNA ligase [Planctomycetes bacterium]|nr:alanine--tRNA ligase [Planctomycetota bacterium]